MTQVLHLLAAEAGFQSRWGIEALRRDTPDAFSAEVKTIGRGGTWRNLFLASNGLRGDACDIIHAWDFRSLTAAVFANRSRIVFTPPKLPTRSQSHWFGMLFKRREVFLICNTETELHAWRQLGASAEFSQLIRPGVAVPDQKSCRDQSLRKALGFDESDHVVLAIGESSVAARHDLSVWGVSIAHVVDRTEKLLLWGRGKACRPALRLAIRFGDASFYSVAEQVLRRSVRYEELYSAADMALVTADGNIDSLPLAICMARGIPIVATPSAIVSESLEDGVTAKIVPPAARQIARAIAELRTSAELRKTLTTAAMSLSREQFGVDRYVAEHRQLYTAMTPGRRTPSRVLASTTN